MARAWRSAPTQATAAAAAALAAAAANSERAQRVARRAAEKRLGAVLNERDGGSLARLLVPAWLDSPYARAVPPLLTAGTPEQDNVPTRYDIKSVPRRGALGRHG